MGGARALIASLGASFSVVAGVALSLLLMSVVVAYPGIVGGEDAPASGRALVIEDQSPTAVRARGEQARATADTVLVKATSAPRKARRPAAVAPRPASSKPAAAKPSFNPRIRDLTPPPPPPPAAAVTPPAPAPAAGDGVRDVGDVVTATVVGTASAAGEATAPLLGPPVSQAVQDVLDLLTSVLQGATGGLAGALDKLPPTR